jgi:predicted nuclease of predicted toxin-antitoxin system
VRILVDENLPVDLVAAAQREGIEAQWVREVLPGAKDVEILDRLRNEAEVLVTRDIRFANLVLNLMASGEQLPGVVLIREQRLELLRKAWMRFLADPVEPKGLAVVTENSVRRRRPQEAYRPQE